MPSQRDLFRFLAEAYFAANERRIFMPAMIDLAAQNGYDNANIISREALTNGLRKLGLVYEDNWLQAPHMPAIEVDIAYTAFKKAAAPVLKEATEPMEAFEIIQQTGLTGPSVPWASMRSVMKDIGAYFIPGVGFWRYKVWSDPKTLRIITMHEQRKLSPLMQLFERHGWPLPGKAVAMWTEGELSAMLLADRVRTSEYFRTIGCGCYVPIDQEGAFPIAQPMALAVYKLADRLKATNKHEPWLYSLLQVMQENELCTAKTGRILREGRRVSAIEARLTKKGERVIETAAGIVEEAF